MGLLSRIGSLFGAPARADSEVSRPGSVALAARPTPPPVPQVRTLASTVGYEPDLNRMNLVPLGTEFEPQTFLGYRRQARWSDPRRLFASADEIQRLLIGSQVQRMRNALAATVDTFSPPDAYKDEHDMRPEAVRAREICEYCEKQFSKYLPDAKRSAGADKFLVGIGPIEIKSIPGAAAGGRPRIVGLDGMAPRRFRMDRATQEWLCLPHPDAFEGIPVADLIADGLLAFLELDAGKTPVDQRGLIWQCIALWTMAQKALRWWGRATELSSVPFRHASYPEGRSDLQPGLVADMQQMGAAPWYVGPDGVKIEFISPPSSGNRDKHEALLQFCLNGFDAMLLGHEQASGVSGAPGSENSSGDAQEAGKELTNARAAIWARDFSELVLRPLIKRTDGEWAAENLLPQYSCRVLERDNPIQLATVAEKLAPFCGRDIDAEDLIQRTGLKVVDHQTNPDAKTLAPSTTAQPNAVAGATPSVGTDVPAVGEGQVLSVAPSAVLNGAQVTAATAIVTAVATKQIPRDSGIGQLMVLFNLDAAQAEAIMGSAGRLPSQPSQAPSALLAARRKSSAPARLRPNGKEIVDPLRKLLSGVKSNSDLLALAAKLERHPAAHAPQLADQLAALLLDARLAGRAEVIAARKESDA